VSGEPVVAPRSDVGIVFQNPVLLPWRSIIDNILLPVDVAQKPRQTYRRRALDLLKLVGLEGFGDRFPWQLSGGMQQRAAICRALIMEPRLLLMDEPFGALDAITREEMGVELLRIWSEIRPTVIFITHSIPEAVFLSDRVFVMSQRPGRIQHQVAVDLPRPRDLDLLREQHFVDLAAQIRSHIEAAHLGVSTGRQTSPAPISSG
jgi:NitT/TauT family transport system ATP-binding protein